MILEIEDSLPGTEKRRQATIQQVAYAMTKFGSKRKAGKFLGYSDRWIRQMCQRNEELKQWRVDDPFEELARKKGPGWVAMQKRFNY